MKILARTHRAFASGMVAIALAAPAAMAQNTEDEWYDPRDWFDEDQEDRREDTSYYNDYYTDGYWNDNDTANSAYDTWQDQDGVWYDSPNYTTSSGFIYIWDPQNRQWSAQRDQTQQANQSRQQDNQNQQTNRSRRQDNQNEQANRDWQQDRPDDRTAADHTQRQQRQDQDQQSRFDDQRQSRQTANIQDQKNRQQRTIQGTVDGFRRVKLTDAQDRRDEHTLVRIQLERGKNMIVDLGPQVNLADLDLQKGDTISVQGKNTMIDDRKVLEASRVTIDGNSREIQRGMAARERTLQGTVAAAREIQPANGKDSHLFVRIELEKGKSALVDFGPGTTMQDLELQEGDRIMVKGNRALLDGQPVLCARAVRVEGEKKDITPASNPEAQQQG